MKIKLEYYIFCVRQHARQITSMHLTFFIFHLKILKTKVPLTNPARLHILILEQNKYSSLHHFQASLADLVSMELNIEKTLCSPRPKIERQQICIRGSPSITATNTTRAYEPPRRLGMVSKAHHSLLYNCLTSIRRHQGNIFLIALSKDFIFTSS